eukprot:2368855-Pleurochrysis_carterae.AAC.1
MAASTGEEEVTCVRNLSPAYARALRNSVLATARQALRSTWPRVSTKAAKDRPEEGEEKQPSAVKVRAPKAETSSRDAATVYISGSTTGS